MLLRENISLAPLTTIGVGGPARYYVEAETEADVAEAGRPRLAGVMVRRRRRRPLDRLLRVRGQISIFDFGCG